MDEEGFYKVVGRIKEIIITAGGENVAPTNIEDEIRQELPALVSMAVICGDGRKFLTCLLTLRVEVDPATMAPTQQLEAGAAAWLKEVSGQQIGALTIRAAVCQVLWCAGTVAELLASPAWPAVEAAISAGIERANDRAVSNVARVKKWKVLQKEFSVEGGELSPTLKLKRFQVAKMYSSQIEEMYEE